jgi:signal transduction histidine kinase
MKLRFPYFYQLMLGFLFVIITLFAVAFLFILHFARSQIINDVEDTFLYYADLIQEAEQDPAKLEAYDDIFRSQNIQFGIFDQEGELQYPHLENEIEVNFNEEEMNRLESGESLFLRLDENDLRGNAEETAMVYVPLINEEDEYTGFTGVGRPSSYLEIYLDELKRNFFEAFLYATGFAIVVSILFSAYLVSRVNRLSNATQKVADGDYDIYIDHSNRDEIDRLSADFNKMVKALAKGRKEVAKLEERRKTFMQDVAHEMRTPLTTINGLLEGIEYGVFDENQTMRSVKLMRKETKRLIRLVNENLDYENIESNRIVLQKQSFPLIEAIDEVREQLTPLTRDSNVEIVIKDNIDDITVYGDFDRFKQIMVNLTKNALQFTNKGEITIGATQKDNFNVITVADTGIGMTEEQLENIWDRYYKADVSRTNTKYAESGLGLPIVKRLVELHDGKIEVESEPGKGTTFTLTFPRKK